MRQHRAGGRAQSRLPREAFVLGWGEDKCYPLWQGEIDYPNANSRWGACGEECCRPGIVLVPRWRHQSGPYDGAELFDRVVESVEVDEQKENVLDAAGRSVRAATLGDGLDGDEGTVRIE